VIEALHIFPHLNATLNASSGVCLIAGLYFILTSQIAKHRVCMLAASTISAIFLVSYVTHHVIRTSIFGLGPTKFTGEGIARPIYFTILTSHTLMAVAVAPFVVLTLWRGLKGRYDQHKRIARLVYPVWLFVSASGVAVYIMLYHLFPAR
jgi:uncharacterized membrane protein YozB (DUF420 family)